MADLDARRVADEVEASLRELARPERAEGERRYLKSELDHLGAGVPAVRRLATAVHRQHTPTHDELIALVAAMWTRGIHELRMAAVELLGLGVSTLSEDDRELLEDLLRQARTWALVDPLAIGVVGVLTRASPDAWEPVLRRWASDPDHWIRRSALLAHLPGVRSDGPEHLVLFPRFVELADAMLDEREFFIRKAIGWVLRETGRRHPALVRDWLTPRAARAAGLTVREAVKHLPEDDRARILAARAAG